MMLPFLRSQFILVPCLAGLSLFQGDTLPPDPETDSQKAPASDHFPYLALLPKAETGVLRFLESHPEFDGRGVTVAVFDTGVDPGAPGLQVTTDGRPKIVDIVDATGSGDVLMETVRQPKDGRLEGLTGRMLRIDPDWENPGGQYRLGLKAGFELFPGELISRLKRERRRDWDRRQDERAAALLRELLAWDEKHPAPSAKQLEERKELEARQEVLQAARDRYEDPGPVYDCVTFHDGEQWWAVIDTDEDGDLTDEQRLTNYHRQRHHAQFDAASQLNFCVNIYDDGQRLSIVTLSGDHGTHVAGIIGACFPEDPSRNGVAPGVQIVSVKIGDTRLGSMETGRGLVRGLRTVLDRNCDLINMSYGEPTTTPDSGRLIDLFSEVVREHSVIFIASAGNSGPALSTVGAPGGSTEAILGIGAYVSPEMMAAEYTIRDKLSGLPYSWTSRGPALDGAAGVDLFAPGGAIAPVPNYNLQPSRRMNGTSMASPNACGNVALLLSGLKAENRQYSPALVRRALQNTTERLSEVDPFAQGAGLIQVDCAWDWLQDKSILPAEQIAYEIEVGSADTRGILLREFQETRRPLVTQVDVRPRFREQEDKRRLVDFEVPLAISCDQTWVHTGDYLLLTARGGDFEVLVDPTGLTPGLHTAVIQARVADRPGRGPLFEIPVTVIKPPEPQAEYRAKATLTAGQVVRGLGSVPEGATWVDVQLRLDAADGPRRFLLHSVQIVPGQSFEEGESKQSVMLEQGSEYVRSIPVVAGRTLEVALAQNWSSLGDSEIEWSVHFRGLIPDDDEITLPSDDGAMAVSVRSQIRRERCDPSGSLTRVQRLLRPKSVENEPLLSPRDRLPDGRPARRLVLHYEFDQPATAQTTIRIPRLDGLLYDAPVEGLQWMLTDSSGRVIHTDDMYPEPFSLKKGSYRLRCEVRLAEASTLEDFESLIVAVDRKLSKPQTLKVYASRAEAASGSDRFPATWLDPGEAATVWLTTGADLPAHVEAGDVLRGSMTFVSSPDGTPGADSRPGGYPLAMVVPPSVSKTSTKPEPSKPDKRSREERLRQERMDLMLGQLGRLDWPEDRELFESLAKKILAADSRAELDVLVKKLRVLDTDDRKQRLPEVVDAADEVIAAIDTRGLRDRLAAQPDPDDTPGQEDLEQARELKSHLVDALYRKGRALAYQELPDVVAEHPIADPQAHDHAFEANFRKLASWVDTTEDDYVLLHIRRDRRRGRYGAALRELNRQIDAGMSRQELLHKKRRDIYESLGWNDWRDDEHKWMLRRFPDTKQPF